jgi:hypothetical protein
MMAQTLSALAMGGRCATDNYRMAYRCFDALCHLYAETVMRKNS